MSKYTKVEPEKPSVGHELLAKSLKEIAIPEVDISALEAKIEKLTEELSKANKEKQDLLRASQEASKQFYKEAIASLGEIAKIKLEASYEASEPLDVQALLEGMAKLIPEPATIPQPEPIDVEGLVEKIFNLTNKETNTPSYDFKVERNHSGVLVGIRATPIHEE